MEFIIIDRVNHTSLLLFGHLQIEDQNTGMLHRLSFTVHHLHNRSVKGVGEDIFEESTIIEVPHHFVGDSLRLKVHFTCLFVNDALKDFG